MLRSGLFITFLVAAPAYGQIEPTWMYRVMALGVWPGGNCSGALGGETTSESGPWEQGLAYVLPCPKGSVYALGSHRSNIGQHGLEAAASLSVGMHGVRFFHSTYYHYDEYVVQFQVPQRGYYRIVSNTGASETSNGQTSEITHHRAHALVALNQTDGPPLIWCESHGETGGDQSNSCRRLLHLESGQYEIGGFGWLEGQLTTFEPGQMSVHLRYDLSLTPVACPADINADDQVDAADLTLLLSHFGDYAPDPDEAADIDGNLWVDAEDLAILLSFFGQMCD